MKKMERAKWRESVCNGRAKAKKKKKRRKNRQQNSLHLISRAD